MSWSAADFRTYPEAPARSASYRNCSLSYIESISSRSSGLRLRSSSAAWMPVVLGMATSRIARCTSPASAFLTASAPSSAPVHGGRLVHSAAVVHDPEDDAAGSRLERDLDPRGLRVPCDVGQALLRDPVDRELGLVGERRQVVGEAPLDPESALVGELARQLGQRADEPEVLEHLRAQLAGDPPHLLQRVAHGRLRLLAPALAFELEQDARQDLADLVVQ